MMLAWMLPALPRSEATAFLDRMPSAIAGRSCGRSSRSGAAPFGCRVDLIRRKSGYFAYIPSTIVLR